MNNIVIFGKIIKSTLKINGQTKDPIIFFEIQNVTKVKGKKFITQLKVEVFGKVAKAIKENVKSWDYVVIEGQIREDRKFKTPKIVVGKIYPVKKEVN